MKFDTRALSTPHLLDWAWVLLAGCLLLARAAAAQDLTGALVGTVKDEQGAVLPGALVRLTSPALIGGPVTITTNERGQLRFPVLPPGAYALDVELPGFAPYREENIRIGAGATLERTVVLEAGRRRRNGCRRGTGSRIEARSSGFETRFGAEYLTRIPTRRFSMFDMIRAAPGVSPTSPSSGTVNTVSAFGSGVNENLFLIDGTNFTCPCQGVSRAEPSVDVIQEVQVQSIGASVEYGNIQGAVFNVITKQGGDRYQYDASYYGQPSGLTSQPVVLPVSQAACRRAGTNAIRYRDFTTNLGGPVVRDRLWFFRRIPVPARLRQPARHGPGFPEDVRAEQDLRQAHVAADAGPATDAELSRRVLGQPETSDARDAVRGHAAVTCAPCRAMTFGQLTHTLSANTMWDVRVGRFVSRPEERPEHRRSDDAEPVRPRHGRLERQRSRRSAGLTLIASRSRRRSTTTSPGGSAAITS